MPKPWVWIDCAWCRSSTQVPYARRPDGPHPARFCSISCGAYASALRLTDREWSARMREAGKKSGRVRRSISLRRAIKALGGRPTRAELTAFQVGWICCRTKLAQRRAVR